MRIDVSPCWNHHLSKASDGTEDFVTAGEAPVDL